MRYYAAAAMKQNEGQVEEKTESIVEKKLLDSDIDSLSPRQALDLLYELKKSIGDDI